ncbi:hypothetical protein HF086_013763 [Spodoptera exigua]|uniref:Survival of motor neuron-related-splicing factor 30 n=1 Tax=Spodoptera exigua TaxID=7107 RepID=A0A922SD06_SPOEX|nr:hypothetical protein HF086_013763 [Spodoptera exigua]
MADDLTNYKLQLLQVEGALLADGDNEELLKLKADLEKVIELTQDLVKTQDGDSKVCNTHGSGNDRGAAASVLAADDEGSSHKYFSNSQVGETCLAKNGKENNKEYLMKKKQKKQQRLKQYEKEREAGKNKWLNFHSKAIKKPGVRAKSIFASPDNLTGRVGVGTCGISGRPMTGYTVGEKWKKGGSHS